MKHMRTKLFVAFLAMTALTAAVLWLVQAGIMKDSVLNERVAAIHGALTSAAAEGSIDAAALEESLNIRLLQLGEDGSVRYLSQGMPMKGMLLRLLQGPDAPAPDGTPVELEGMMDESVRHALVGCPVPSGGALYAVFSLSDVEETSRILRQQLWVVTVVLLVASVGLAAALSRLFAHPLRRITGAARALAAGRLETRVDVRSRDEIGQLAAALNDLSGQLQKTEALRRELIANVSHELRSPLAVIQGYAETVRDVTWPQAEKRQEQLTIVAQEAARLSTVVEDILDYSKLQAGVETIAPAPIALRPALEQQARRRAQQAEERGLTITVECPDMTVEFDPGRFDRVLDNLLGNAINHADPGAVILLTAQERAGQVRIWVSNHGRTIAPEEIPYLWDRFYRAQAVNEGRRLGTGLGLAIVRSILEQHGAAYGVQSENGVTTFWFDAPPARG